MQWRRAAAASVVAALALGGLFVVPAAAEVRWPPTPSTIIDSGPDAIAPQVASLGSDDAVAVWEDCSCIGIKAAIWDGSAWTSSEIISDFDPPGPDPIEASEPQVTGTAPGEAIAVWNAFDTGTGDVTIQASHYSGGVWSQPEVISRTPDTLEASEPHVAGRADGTAVAVWVATFTGPIFQIDAATFDPGTGDWTLASAPISDPAGEPTEPRVATTGVGTAVAVWTDLCLCGGILASTLNGTTWSATPDALSDPADDSFSPAVVATNDGGAVATWVADTSGGDTLIQGSRFDGATWTATPDVSSATEFVFFIPIPGFEAQSITSATPGQATVAWVGFDFGTGDFLVHSAVFAGGAWSAPADLANSLGGAINYAFPDITTVDPGVALVVWATTDGSDFSIQAATYDGVTATPAVNVAPTSIYVEAPQAVGTGGGTAVTVWIDGDGVDFIVQGARGAPASRTVSTTGGDVTIFTSAGGLVRVSGSAVPTTPTPPPGVQFPYGVFDFTIVNLVPGSSATITITLPAPVTQYWKLHGAAWYQLTGATFAGNNVTFTLLDGGPDDADAAADGSIVDPGGPTIAALAAVGVIPRFTG